MVATTRPVRGMRSLGRRAQARAGGDGSIVCRGREVPERDGLRIAVTGRTGTAVTTSRTVRNPLTTLVTISLYALYCMYQGLAGCGLHS